MPGHYSRPLHARHGGLPRSCRQLQPSLPRKITYIQLAKRSPLSRFLPACFGERESACGSVFTPRCSVLDPESQSLHAFIYCVNGGERSRRNTAGRGPTLPSGVLVSFPSYLLSSFLFLFFQLTQSQNHKVRPVVKHKVHKFTFID